MLAKFIGSSGTGFKQNIEYNIDTTLINSVIYVKNKTDKAFCIYSSIDDFLKDWEIKHID